MSTRQIKKLRAQEELRNAAAKAAHAQTPPTSGDESEDDIDVRPARVVNAFAAFAALEEDDNKEEEEEEEGEEENEEKAPDTPKSLPKAAAGKKKKNKSKNKKKAKAAKEDAPRNAGSGGDSDKDKGKNKNLATPNKNKSKSNGKGDDLDEIDRALEELKLSNKSAKAEPGPVAGLAPQKHAVYIDLHNLRVTTELRNVFGSEVLATAHADDMANGAANERARGERIVNVDLDTYFRAPANAAGHSHSAGLIAKRNPFIQWKDTWPRATSGGLSMKQVGAPDAYGVVEYTFVHGSEYIALEQEFQTLTLVQQGDTDALFGFLHAFPFHIASLTVVSIFARTHDHNPSLAADLMERALFSFGRVAVSSFRAALTDARGCKARLSFRRPENRQFVLAGYHYIRSLMGRGTFRTALEWVKLFLGVMPDDDYGLLLLAQTTAIQSFEAQWFVDYIGTYDAPCATNIWPMLDYIKQSVVPAKLQLEDTDGARAALHEGVARVPWLYGALFQALDRDVPRAVWGVLPRSDVETLYTQLYIETAKALWTPAVMDFAEAELAGLAKADAKKIPDAFPVTQTIARFVYLGNTPSLMGLVVPKSLLHSQPNTDFDPLPPKREDNIFSYPGQQRPWAMAEPNEAGSVSAIAAAIAAMTTPRGPEAAGAVAAIRGVAAAGGDGRGFLDFIRGFTGGRDDDDDDRDPAVVEAMNRALQQMVESDDGDYGELEDHEAGESESEDDDDARMPGGWVA